MKRISLVFSLIFCTTMLWSQNFNFPLIGQAAPSFTANSTNGIINFPGDFNKNWKILFSHPRDFTPVCTSEILQLARMQQEFDSLGVKLAVISTDEIMQHEMWKSTMESILESDENHVNISFPLIDDSRCVASNIYGMIHEKSNDVKDVRGVFIINPDNVIQAIFFYPMKVGRNLEEIKRTVIALQTVNNHVSTPVNWKPGDDILMPASPYLIEFKKDSAEISKQYYNIGPVMWFKKRPKA